MGLFERLLEFPAGRHAGPPLDLNETRALLDAVTVDGSSVMGVPWETSKEMTPAYLSGDMRGALVGGASDNLLLGKGRIGGFQAEFEFVFSDGAGLQQFGLIPIREVPYLSSVLTARLGMPVAATTLPRRGADVLHALWTGDGYDMIAAMTPFGAAEIAYVTDRRRRRRVVGRRISGPESQTQAERSRATGGGVPSGADRPLYSAALGHGAGLGGGRRPIAVPESLPRP